MEIKKRRRRKVKVRVRQPMVDRRREKQVDARPTNCSTRVKNLFLRCCVVALLQRATFVRIFLVLRPTVQGRSGQAHNTNSVHTAWYSTTLNVALPSFFFLRIKGIM
jgi:hypothetical protein